MNRFFLPTIFASFLVLTSCKEEKKQDQTQTETEESQTKTSYQKPDKDAETYAELSIRKGDNWKPEKFGGGEFMNVDSLQLPEGHSDHAYYIRYEGPGWENSQVTIVLPYVGQENYEDYHHDSGWGQDILKAGKSVGLGGYGRYMNDSVAERFCCSF